jgi:hypothetical protein
MLDLPSLLNHCCASPETVAPKSAALAGQEEMREASDGLRSAA